MADAVTSQVLINNQRNLIMKFTNVSDGTGESAVTKVDATSATYAVSFGGATSIPPGVNLRVTRVAYDITSGMKLRIQWNATSNVDMLVLAQPGSEFLFGDFGGLISPAVAGATGSIQFTTVGAALNSTYTVILWMTKGIPQS